MMRNARRPALSRSGLPVRRARAVSRQWRRHPLPALVACSLLYACAPGAPGPAPAAPPGAPPIVASIDLAGLDADRVAVVVDPGPIEQDEVLFRLPRVVQGTYDVSDFGRFTEELTAVATDGTTMAADRVDVNTWRIRDATRLDRVTYRVNDTFDQERTPGTEMPFSPSGTNIDPDAFVLNLHGFVGYFEGMTEWPYEVRVRAPLGLSRASALPAAAADTSAAEGTVTDVYRTDRYFGVTDNPMFYGDVDSRTFTVGGVEITLAVYSPTGVYSAARLEGDVSSMMEAQRRYLGDLRTADRYGVYLFLASEEGDAPTGFGALEHHTSTVVVLPELLPGPQMTDAMVDVVSHEFFHIVTPLGVHSEDVHDFDYNVPTFSKHLWMYEGVTEYFASHFQVYEGLESRQDFYRTMAGKVESSMTYDDAMSFTTMSENILEEPYEENFANVYDKGALIGMCLDVILRQESGGERSMMSLMTELALRYGVDRAFEDDALMAELTAMTYPRFGRFLETHVVGGTPIDYGDCLEPVGLEVVEQEIPVTLFFRDAEIPFIDLDPATGEIFFRDIALNSTLVALGVQGGDVLLTVNGREATLDAIPEILGMSMGWTPDTPIQVGIRRDGQEMTLSGTAGTPTLPATFIREADLDTPAQQALRDAWLGG